MNEDLEFRHEGSVFTVCGSFYKYTANREIINVGISLRGSVPHCMHVYNLPSRDNTAVTNPIYRLSALKVKYKLYFPILNQILTVSAPRMFDI